jgi:hypothetical protein
MQQRNLTAVLALTLAGLIATGCKQAAEEEAIAEPAKVEQIGNTDVSRVTLEPQAAKRIDAQTAPVRRHKPGESVPYSAILYDADGTTFVYVSPEPLSFQREEVEVDRVEGDEAILAKGPAAGTQVLTRGVQEVYGTEFGVDE